MDFCEFTAGKDDDDRRIDKILRILIKSASLSEIYKALRSGLIKLNHKKCKPETHVFEGDIISVASFLMNHKDDNNVESEALNSSLDIIFENENLLIINKPYNINVHGDEKSLEKKVLEYYKSKNKKDSISFTPGPLHRLDKKTTGLLSFSFSLIGARWFSENISTHAIRKTYFAIIQGILPEEIKWEDIIKNDRNENKGFHTVKAVSSKTNTGKNAVSIFKPISYGKYNGLPVTFAEIKIITGRKHQIRSQSSLHGYPLLGDTAYGGKKIEDSGQDFFLHAGKLNLPANNLGIPEELAAAFPATFLEFLKRCEINNIGL